MEKDSPTEAGSTAEAPGVRCERCNSEYEGSGACPVCGLSIDGGRCEAHPEERAEGRCVICGRALCAECRPAVTNPYLCAEHEGITLIDGWAQVYRPTGEIEALLLRDNLQAEGIDAQIFSQKDHMYPVGFGDLSIVRLIVPVWQYAQAREVIREHMDGEGEVSFAEEDPL